ncbi:MAG: hypothetical protein WDM96_03685 [Lacunisphaera sp.]
MKTLSRARFPVAGLLFALAGLAGSLTLAGCYETSGSGRVSVGATGVIGEDDYVYYPGSEVYYSPTHRYYYYRDGNAWVHRPQPPKVWAHNAPSVNVHFKDNPERHHSDTVRQYPHNWHPPAKPSNDHHDRDDHGGSDRNEHKP